MNRLIFLDIDGVLNNHDWHNALYAAKFHGSLNPPESDLKWVFDPGCVARLAMLCYAIENPVIVVTSTLRLRYSETQLRDALYSHSDFAGAAIYFTNDLHAERGVEIADFLSRCEECYGVILDDDSDMGPLLPYRVGTHLNSGGLRSDHLYNALRIFESQEKGWIPSIWECASKVLSATPKSDQNHTS